MRVFRTVRLLTFFRIPSRIFRDRASSASDFLAISSGLFRNNSFGIVIRESEFFERDELNVRLEEIFPRSLMLDNLFRANFTSSSFSGGSTASYQDNFVPSHGTPHRHYLLSKPCPLRVVIIITSRKAYLYSTQKGCFVDLKWPSFHWDELHICSRSLAES